MKNLKESIIGVLMFAVLVSGASCGSNTTAAITDQSGVDGVSESNDTEAEETSSGVAVASRSQDIRFYYVAPPNFPEQDCDDSEIFEHELSASQRMQCLFGRDHGVVMVDYSSGDPDPETDVFILSQEQVAEEMDYFGVEDNYACASSAQESPCAVDPDNPSCGLQTTAASGTNGLPKGMDADWDGYGQGGCGTWATAMCDRILGRRDGEVTEDEWNDIAEEIGQENGGSTISNQAGYYEDAGYCVTTKKFNKNNYSELKEQFDDGCDVKLAFWKRNADGTYSNGHVETVTGATDDSATTNSWGKSATVSGGDDGDFSHSDGAFPNSSDMWPADSTEVWVQYVCECSALEKLGRWIFGK